MKKFFKACMLLLALILITGGFGAALVSGDSPEGVFTFLIGNKEIKDGDTIDYSLYNNEDSTITIILRNTEGIEAGTKLTWVVSNNNIIKVNKQDNSTCSVTLDIISPGYSGLSATMETPDGKIYTAVAYCSIYVPLQWSDNVSTTKVIMNNIMASDSNGNYGLLFAQTGDSTKNDYTLQLYTSDSAEHPDCSHYLRKLKYVKYGYNSDDPATTEDETTLESVRSDVEAGELGPFTAALEWSSSDSDIVEVDSLTGLVTAKHAGFATITVRTSTENEKQSSGDTLSYDVVVVPECYISGYNTSADSKSSGTLTWNSSSLILQSNAKFANTLEWRIFRGDVITESADITSDLKEDMTAGDSNGRFVLDNLKAGVYYVTAVPVKSSDAATSTATYDVTTSKIKALEYVVIVPVSFPPESVTLSYYNTNIYDSFDLLANSNLPSGIFRFKSDNETIAKVGSDSGVIDAVGEGNTDVIITLKDETGFDKLFGSYADDSATINYNKTTDKDKKIDVTVYDGIAINTSYATLNLGAQLQLSLTAPSPYQGDLYWSSADESVAEVDETGLVTAKKLGETTVTVRIKVGSGVTKRAQCTVKVVASVSSITLTATSQYVNVDENLTITANITPKVQNASLKWTSSDESVAAISSTNPLSVTITGVKAGTTVITAVNPDNGVVGTMMIHVVSEITSLTLSDSEVVLSKATGFYQLYATCVPSLPENEELTWSSSDTKVLTVDKKGKVSIVNSGSAIITVVSENGKMASCKFTILQGMESITLDETTLTMYVGDTYRMAYTISPDTVSDKTIKWTSTDSKVVSVDSTGFFTAKNTGTCVITAQAQDGSGLFTNCTVTVLRNASTLTLDVSELTMNVGDTYQLEIQLKPEDSTDTVVFESNNTKIAAVSSNGKITAKSKGNCMITAKTEAGVSAYCNINVTQQVTGVTVSPATGTVNVGDTLQLTCTIAPENATDKEVEWTSTDTKVATVDEEGLVKGVGGGFTIIKCTTADGDYMSYSLITVEEKVTTITIDETAEVGVGKKLKLTATVSGEKATNKNVKWASSNKKICKVSKSGVIKGIKAGTVTIRVKATDGSGVYADCEVKVIKATEDIELSATYVTLTEGERIRLKATTTPSKVTYSVVWASDNSKVAAVSKKGRITALKAGDCIISCTAGDNPDVYALCYVHVTAPVAISSINLSEEAVVLVTGESASVQYSISPANYTESFSWGSDNTSVATVDSNGKITARSVGTARVTAMSRSGKTSVVDVYVVGLSKTKITLHQYESTKIKLELDGVGAGDIDIRWDTDNQGIAEIANGKVTGKALGTTTVYAIVNGKYLACTVKVIKN